MTHAEIVEGMLTILNGPDSWCKGVLHDSEGRHCLLGALHVVMKCDYWTYSDELLPLLNVMDGIAREKGYQATYPGHGGPTVEFNNARETEYEDVRLFLKEVLVRV